MIKEDEYANEQIRISATQGAIYRRLEELARKPSTDTTDTSINTKDRAVYEKCLEKLDSIEVIATVVSWPDLDRKLTDLMSTGRPMFDVTTLKKNLLVDVTALLLSRGFSDVYSFELMKDPSYNDGDLIHALGDADYRYRSLAESRHVETARRRMVSRSFRFRTVAWLTLAITIIVASVQAFFPHGWAQSTVTVIATVASIVGWLYFFRRDNST
ncbi:hypothetical protein [Actinomadura flavalba]|uniref:hypothetical protein n=1 Tax=Actinomadura flavalba TaxID=1120938 RepID=UPI0012DE45C8|nr:hypothetical protein [Actinomadura flavalba]